ncbi:MAG: hypothetical protein AB8G18_15255 [Gammaproteobacteria bacterium]
MKKEEKIRRVSFRTQEEARRIIFNYIEMYYTPRRYHTSNNKGVPAVYEQQYFMNQDSV